MKKEYNIKAKELAELLFKYPHFEVEFSFSELDNTEYGMSVRTFKDILLTDIGYSDEIIILGGEEI